VKRIHSGSRVRRDGGAGGLHEALGGAVPPVGGRAAAWAHRRGGGRWARGRGPSWLTILLVGVSPPVINVACPPPFVKPPWAPLCTSWTHGSVYFLSPRKVMGGSAVSAGLNHSPWPPGITDLNKRPGVSLSSLGVTTLTASCPTTRPLCTALPPPEAAAREGQRRALVRWRTLATPTTPKWLSFALCVRRST